MAFDQLNKELSIFLNANYSFEVNDLSYRSKENILKLSLQKKEIIIVPSALNEKSHFTTSFIRLIESLTVGDELIVFGNYYDSLTRRFINRKMSETELLGLFYCGGYVLELYTEINSTKLYRFKRKKHCSVQRENRSPFITLNRVGQYGTNISIHKIRTMYPYAKYLHEYMLQNEGYNNNGKVNNDFRVTKIGKMLRKYYLDEIPQIVNLLKGEIGIVGCRPASNVFLKSYPREVYDLRLKYKPGIVSPVIADNAKSVNDVIKSEYNYLVSRKSSHYKIDFRVFYKAFVNVLLGKVMSQ